LEGTYYAEKNQRVLIGILLKYTALKAKKWESFWRGDPILNAIIVRASRAGHAIVLIPR
jgi:hypothetical protein